MLSRGPSGDRIARSCRHTSPELTVRVGVKDRQDRKTAIIAICFGLLGPFKPWLYALKSSKNSHRIANQFLRHYRFLLQRSCRLLRDRRREDMSRKGGGTLTLRRRRRGRVVCLGGGRGSSLSLSRDFRGRCFGDLGNAQWLTLWSNPHHLVRF